MQTNAKVLDLRALGLKYHEISDRLGISIHTVRFHCVESRRINCINRISEHRIKIKRKAVDFSGGRCLKCNACIECLTFHHLDPKQKETKIGSGNTRSWEHVRIELLKTILLCCRCHTEHHAGLWMPDQEIIDRQGMIRDNYIDKPLVDYKI